MQRHEGQAGFGVAAGARPALHDNPATERNLATQDGSDSVNGHGLKRFLIFLEMTRLGLTDPVITADAPERFDNRFDPFDVGIVQRG